LRKPLQLLIPAAGHGSRFSEIGVAIPKPLIPILNYPMICHVIANFPLIAGDKVVIIGQKIHNLKKSLEEVNLRKDINFQFIEIESVTQGAASTCLLAETLLDPELPLVIANSDQWLVDGLIDFVESVTTDASDSGYVLTMFADDPKWSYAEIDEDNQIKRLVEKVVISSHATVGIYGWTKAKLFLNSAWEMIENGDKSQGEFYVAPSYNYLLSSGYIVKSVNVGAVENAMYGLGTPRDLELFLENAVLKLAEKRVTDFFRGKHAD